MDTTDPFSADPYDVVVVGARAAGAATAMLLARAHLRVLLIDRSEYGTDTLSTHALMRAGVIQLHRWGLLDQVRAAGTPPVRRTIFAYGTESTQVTLKPVGGVDALFAPKRTLLDSLLVDAARHAGADVRFGLSATGVLLDGTGRVAGVTVRAADGRTGSIRSGLTIGADGRTSRIARAVGAPFERVASSATSVVYGYVDGMTSDAYEWFYGPGVTAGVIPTNDGASVVFAGAPPDRVRAEVRGDVRGGFHRLLGESSSELLDRVASHLDPRALHRFEGIKGYLRRPWGPGWALVGDSGYFRDPISAHGISDALRDAELVARAVLDARHETADEVLAFREYQQTRDRLSAHLFEATDRIASFAWDTTTVQQHLRELSASMADEVSFLVGLGRLDADGLAVVGVMPPSCSAGREA